MVLTTSSRFRDYEANEKPITRKDGLLFRKYDGKTGSVKFYQIVMLKQLIDEIIRRLHLDREKPLEIPRRLILMFLQTKILSSQHGAADQKVGHVM